MADEPTPPDPSTPDGMIWDRLERDLRRAEQERDALREMVGRPITVTQGDGPAMTEFRQHIPKLSQISEHLSTIAGQLMQAQNKLGSSGDAMVANALQKQTETLERIADVLDRLAPVPADLGDEREDEVTDRFVHVDEGNWSTTPVWAGRLCKRYGKAWTVFDPGPNDPVSAGGSCALQHPGQRR